MTSPLIVNHAHPHVDFNGITQLGLKAQSVALLHKPVLEPRLPAGTLDGLDEDLVALGAAVPGARQTRDEARTATAAQRAAGRNGYAKVTAVRTAVRKSKAPDEVQSAYGVGQLVNVATVRDVQAALQQILDRAAASPAEAAGLGIVQKDLDAIAAARAALDSADKTQEQKRAKAPESTQVRNRTANRILKAVALIAAAGGLEFAGDASALAAFEALKPPSRGKKKAPKSDAPAQGGAAPQAPS